MATAPNGGTTVATAQLGPSQQGQVQTIQSLRHPTFTLPVQCRLSSADAAGPSQVRQRVVSVRVDPDQTAAVLKACLADQYQLDASTISHPLTFTGQEVSDGESLKQVGLTSSAASIQGCGSQLFPNGWFESPFTKAFAKVQDITWPPLRPADLNVTSLWALLLAALLLLTPLLG